MSIGRLVLQLQQCFAKLIYFHIISFFDFVQQKFNYLLYSIVHVNACAIDASKPRSVAVLLPISQWPIRDCINEAD